MIKGLAPRASQTHETRTKKPPERRLLLTGLIGAALLLVLASLLLLAGALQSASSPGRPGPAQGAEGLAGLVKTEAPGALGSAEVGMTLEERLRLQQAVSSEYTRRVRSMLEGPFGAGRVEAVVNVELDFDRVEETIREFEAPGAGPGVVRSRQSSEERFEGIEEPGKAKRSRVEEIINNELSETERRREIPPGALKRVSVAVLIDGELSDEMEASVASAVSSALGLSPSRGDQVHVDSFPFLLDKQPNGAARDQFPGGAPPYALPGAVAAALVAAAFFAVIRRRRSGEGPGPGVPGSGGVEAWGDASEEATSLDDHKRSELRDSLVSVAREKPQDVARLLRAWLADE